VGGLNLPGIEIAEAGKRGEYTLTKVRKMLMVSQLIHRLGRVRSLPATTVVVITLVTSLVGQDGQPTGAAKRGEPFELKAHAASRLADENLLVRFERVTEDSRCPVKAQCVWAGDAAIELTLEKPPAAAGTRILHTNERFGRQADYEGLVIRVLDLKPQPREGATIAPEDYRVTLVVDKGTRTPDLAEK
jgi:hypothetical protein